MPVPLSVGQHYDVDPRDYWRDSYFREDPDYLQGLIGSFTKLAGRPPRGRALDIGAGIGKGIIALRRAGLEAEGIEPSETFCRVAAEHMGIQSDQLHLQSVEEARFPEDCFDLINFTAVLEHLVDPALMLAKAVSWLRPEGLMYVEVPSSAFLLSKLVRLFYQLNASDFVINTCPMHVPYHLYEFSLDSFKRHGARSGYSIASYAYYPCAGYMPRFLIPVFDQVMRLTDTGMQLAVWLRKSAPGSRQIVGSETEDSCQIGSERFREHLSS